jgi:hypothetical protein
VGIKFEQPTYTIPLGKTTNTLLKVVHIEEEINTPPPGALSSMFSAFSAPEITLPDEISFEGFYVNGENVYIYVKPKSLGSVKLEVKLDSAANWPAALCDIIIYDPNPAAAAMALSASSLFSSLNDDSLSNDTGIGTRVLQGPDLFESAMFRNKGTLKPLSKGETSFFPTLEKLPSGRDSVSRAIPLNWFGVKHASFAPIEAGDPTAPLGLRIPGGRKGSEAYINAPLGYPIERSYLPMQAIFIVPRGVYGAGAHDLTIADPSLLLSEYCKILLQLPSNTVKRTIDLFGGEVEDLTVAEAMRSGTLEFFQDTATGELLVVLNFLLIDGNAPDEHDTVTYGNGLLRVYDGLLDGAFRERLWLAEHSSYNNTTTNPGDRNTEDEPGTPNPGQNNGQNSNENAGNNKSSGGNGGSGCNAGYGMLAILLIICGTAILRK